MCGCRRSRRRWRTRIRKKGGEEKKIREKEEKKGKKEEKEEKEEKKE